MTEEYTYLFNTITTAIERLEEIRKDLIFSQQQAEEIYLKRTEV